MHPISHLYSKKNIFVNTLSTLSHQKSDFKRKLSKQIESSLSPAKNAKRIDSSGIDSQICPNTTILTTLR
jgi:hypothetical protein